MCSVVGFIGSKNSQSQVLEGLLRLEYRGYDSAGFACVDQQTGHIACVKTPGSVAQLQEQLLQTPIDGHIGIGHTRWSTHGVASEQNAHPHVDCRKQISLVHNGIIENYYELREQLALQGHLFVSQTDSEVIAHLFESLIIQTADIYQATMQLVHVLRGAYACVVFDQNFPDTLVAIRRRSPLCIGKGAAGFFVASDELAFAGKVDQVLFMPDESFALVTRQGIQLYNFLGKQLTDTFQPASSTWHLDDKQGYAHYMLKEIYEQKRVIYDIVKYVRLVSLPSSLASLSRVYLLGCGTSLHAGRIGQFFFEAIAQVPTMPVLASEFRYMPLFSSPESICFALSQSGETADTLEAVRGLIQKQIPVVAITNVPTSSLARESGSAIEMKAGPEIAVASTKAFTAQVAVLYWLAHYIAYTKGLIAETDVKRAENELLICAELLENSIERYKNIITELLAAQYSVYKHFIFLGRHVSSPFAAEAALKLKEISYLFVDCYPAGELKHGSIALIDAHTPVFIFSVLDREIYQKLVANAQEVKARSGHLVVFAFEGQEELIRLADTVFIFPQVAPLLAPLVMTGVMQFFAYQIALLLGRSIDKPRNLAKSVTVE